MSTPRGTWHPAIADKSEGAGAGWVAAGGSRVGRGAGRSLAPRQPAGPLTLIRNCG